MGLPLCLCMSGYLASSYAYYSAPDEKGRFRDLFFYKITYGVTPSFEQSCCHFLFVVVVLSEK